MKSDLKVALVTGSATGVGAATCIELASRGWNVVINYSRSAKEAQNTAKLCQSEGSKVLIVQADVADNEACIEMVSKTIEKWGRLDALINNAGTTKFCDYGNLDGLDKTDFLSLYEINVVGAYQMSRAAAPYLKSSKGSIVNTSSISAISGVGSSIAYAASKGAMSTMTLSLAHALAPDVRVNAVCPGFIQGRWTKGFLGDRYETVKNGIEQSSLLDKTAVPEDIAKSIVYLIEGAVITTGELLTLDAGYMVNQSKL